MQVKRCLFCGNTRWNLELSAAKGVYSCWACPASGTLSDFLEDRLGMSGVDVSVDPSADVAEDTRTSSGPGLGINDLVPPWEVPSARRYLERRGISAADCRRFEIGSVKAGHPLAGRIAFRLREFFSREPVGYVARSYIGERPKYQAVAEERPLPIVGYGEKYARGDPCVVVEGVFDGIRAAQAGYTAAALLGLHERGVEEWASRLAPSQPPVVVALDGEAREEAEQLRWLLEPVLPQVKVLELPPERDPADLDTTGLRGAIQSLVTDGGE